MKRLILALALVTVPVTGLVQAHHSFAAHYFEDQSTSIEGEVAEFAYRSPHAWLYIMVADQRGGKRRVGAEWASPDRLVRAGITKDTIKPGDYVIVTGSPGRNPADFAVHLKAIERPSDGWSWRPQPRSRP
jgi:Family of unknown function (DUF6152)